MARKMVHDYNKVPQDELGDQIFDNIEPPRRKVSLRSYRLTAIMAGLAALIVILVGFSVLTSGSPGPKSQSCDQSEAGYQCRPEISHYWGQYSPFYSIPSRIPADTPKRCKITFAQVLSRHGARDPTESKTKSYKALVDKIHSNTKSYKGKFAFIKDYSYTLGADQLTDFGQQQMVNSGIKFYNRYRDLTQKLPPFVRSSDQTRVVESGLNFTQGYHKARSADKGAVGEDTYPYPIVTISEDDDKNNTLNHALCKEFEEGQYSEIGDEKQVEWRNVFVPAVQKKVNSNLEGANLTAGEIILFMDLCPFNTVAAQGGKISPFCNLFTEKEWRQYDYYQSVGKYYGYSNGNPLGPTQGVGFTNELIARMTGKPVVDSTSVNHTLDDNPATFPVGKGHAIFADFSHDNDMTAIFSALGLYNSTKDLSTSELETTTETNGYAASWTASFAARAYFEKMRCEGSREEMVRVLVNDRVVPLTACGSDSLGRCKLSRFVDSLSFARSGGRWNECFA